MEGPFGRLSVVALSVVALSVVALSLVDSLPSRPETVSVSISPLASFHYTGKLPCCADDASS